MPKYPVCSADKCHKKAVALGWLGARYCKEHKIESDQISKNTQEYIKNNPKRWEEIQISALEKVEKEKIIKKGENNGSK